MVAFADMNFPTQVAGDSVGVAAPQFAASLTPPTFSFAAVNMQTLQLAVLLVIAGLINDQQGAAASDLSSRLADEVFNITSGAGVP